MSTLKDPWGWNDSVKAFLAAHPEVNYGGPLNRAMDFQIKALASHPISSKWDKPEQYLNRAYEMIKGVA